MEDFDLIQKYLAGRDETVFGILVDRYKDRVFRLALSVLGPYHEEEAQDVTQETFVRVYRKLEDFRGECAFGTWLYRIAYNQASSHRQNARNRRPHVSVEVLHALPGPDEETNPFVQVSKAEQRCVIRAALENLPEVYRLVLNMFYWMDCSVQEIAEYLAAPEGTVKAYLHRGRQRLHEILEKRGWENAEAL